MICAGWTCRQRKKNPDGAIAKARLCTIDVPPVIRFARALLQRQKPQAAGVERESAQSRSHDPTAQPNRYGANMTRPRSSQ